MLRFESNITLILSDPNGEAHEVPQNVVVGSGNVGLSEPWTLVSYSRTLATPIQRPKPSVLHNSNVTLYKLLQTVG